MMLEHLITNRTQADVADVKSLAEAIKLGKATPEQVQQYLNVHQKGAYTYEDLNRVEAAVWYVVGEMKSCGYLQYLPVIQYWERDDKPNEEDFNRYFGNVAMLRSSIPIWNSTPEAPTGVVGFDFHKANALEQILVDIELILEYMKQAWFYLGDVYSGEV